jgi:hypothetical protein
MIASSFASVLSAVSVVKISALTGGCDVESLSDRVDTR